MKLIGITQRVDMFDNIYKDERRDAIDQKWYDFIAALGYTPIAIPNDVTIAKQIINNLSFAGFIFSGGNNLSELGGNAPERDETENFIMDFCSSNNIPIASVCRGTHFLLFHAGANIIVTEGHWQTTHSVKGKINRDEVNSYHNWSCIDEELPEEYEITSKSPEGIIESFISEERKHMGTMWHPERETPFNKEDLALFKEFFDKHS